MFILGLFWVKLRLDVPTGLAKGPVGAGNRKNHHTLSLNKRREGGEVVIEN